MRALDKALENTGQIPEIFNTDQGCQFTSQEWTGRLLELGRGCNISSVKVVRSLAAPTASCCVA